MSTKNVQGEKANVSRRNILLGGTTLAAASAMASATPIQMAQAQQRPAQAQQPAAPSGQRPNILVIFGDDIGQTNISAYSFGLMGYKTPNIDRVAREGMMFTDYYAEQSCTAGRSSFITGQCTLRTGLSKVGIPGATVGLQARDVTLAELLKPLGYATGQFGKNHLGDRNEFLPTVHGFDEFYGNLYHLNAEEDPESRTYPRDPKFLEALGPRGVLRCKASDRDDPTDHPRWGKVGRQTIEDTGPLNKKRMETIDDETSGAAIDFMQRQARANKPFFCWFNSTRMHFRTHVRESHRDKPGLTSRTEYNDGMIEHDAVIGTILKAVDDLGIGNNTIVIYTTDNGPHQNSWPDAGTTPFRSEKNTNWEGAFRVPCLIRWPGRIAPGSVSNDIFSGLDWTPTLMAAAGDPDIKDKLLRAIKSEARPTRSIWTATINFHTSRASKTSQRARSSSTSTMMATLSVCVMKTGRSFSRSSARKAPCESGPSRSPSCVSRNSSTCGRTPTSAQTSRRTPSTTFSCRTERLRSSRLNPSWRHS
jgi:arylsulfatase